MRRTMAMMCVAALLIALPAAKAARAQQPEGPPAAGDPMLWAGLDDEDGPDAGMQPGGQPHMDMHGDMHGGPMMGRRGGMMGGGAMRMRMTLRDLDLAEAQRGQIADVHDRQQRKAIQAEADLRLARLDLGKLMRADKPDQRAIDAQIDRMATVRAGLQKSRIAAMLEVRALLTPEQQKKLHERREGGDGGERIRIERKIRERHEGGDL
jgi:Spy/CpxP family protein refolding chaperone